MLFLTTFGGLSLRHDDALVTGAAAQRRRLALLAAIAAPGERGVSRDRLVVLFWPESSEEKARHALGQALYATKRDLGIENLVHGTTELRLVATEIESDVRLFSDALARGDLSAAVAAYTGPFLDGFHMSDAPEFERWVEDERARLHREYADALSRLASDADASGDAAVAVVWWKRLAAADPLSARAACGLMNAYVAAGDRSAALQHAMTHTALVRDQLGVEPDGGVTSLAERIASAAQGEASVVTAARNDRDEVPRIVDAPPPLAHGAPIPVPTATTPRSRLRRVVALALVGVSIGVVAIIANRPDRVFGHASPSDRRVIVARFDNETGDSALAGLGQAAADWVADGLTRTGIVDVVDAQSMRASTRWADSLATSSSTRLPVMAENAGASIIVWGRVYRDGDSVVFRAQMSDAKTGTILRMVGPVRGPAGRPMVAVDELRSRVMGALGTILDARIASLTTPAARPPTFEAYRLYMEGLDSFAIQRYLPARALFFRAASADTSFLLPLLWAHYAAVNGGDRTLSDSVISVLIARRDELPPAERHGVDAFKAERSGDRVAELEAYRRASVAAPRSQWMFMRGVKAKGRGYYDEALSSISAIDPYTSWARGWPQYWITYLETLHLLGRYDDELRAIHQGQQAFPRMALLNGREMMAVAATRDVPRVLRMLDSLAEKLVDTTSIGPYAAFHGAIHELDAHGSPAEVLRVAEACVAYHRRVGDAGISGGWVTYRKIRAYCFTRAGMLPDAHRDWEQVIRLGEFHPLSYRRSDAAQAQTQLGILAARRGDTAEVNRIVSALPASYARANKYRGPYLANVDIAKIFAASGDRDQAVHFINRAVDIEGPIDDSHSPWLAPLRGYRPYEALRLRPQGHGSWKSRVMAIFASR